MLCLCWIDVSNSDKTKGKLALHLQTAQGVTDKVEKRDRQRGREKEREREKERGGERKRRGKTEREREREGERVKRERERERERGRERETRQSPHTRGERLSVDVSSSAGVPRGDLTSVFDTVECYMHPLKSSTKV